MASRSPGEAGDAYGRLPDLPAFLFPDHDQRDSPLPSVRGQRAARASIHPARAHYMPAASRPMSHPRVATRSASAAPPREMIVLPQPRQVVAQTVPNVVTAGSLLLAVQFLPMLSPAGLPLWTAVALIPTFLVLMFANGEINPLWKRAALINLATVAALLPLLSIRRHLARLPFVDNTHGALLAPVIVTALVGIVLIGIGIGSAVVSREDPEYAGVIFLPACLLVPACSGAADGLALSGSLRTACLVFLAAAILTVVASLLPGALPALVAPTAIAVEFLFLTLFRQTPVFPTASGISAKVLFFGLIAVTVMIAVVVPLMSVWSRRVQFEVRRLEFAQA